MDGFSIYLSQVLAEVRLNGVASESPFFSIAYRKSDGSYGEKRQVRRRAGTSMPEKKDLLSVKTEIRRAGKLKLIDESGQMFELHIPLLIAFNGKTIDHRF